MRFAWIVGFVLAACGAVKTEGSGGPDGGGGDGALGVADAMLCDPADCVCEPGYLPDGDHCVDLDECEDPPCHELAICANSSGSFSCSCPPGMVGDGLTDCHSEWALIAEDPVDLGSFAAVGGHAGIAYYAREARDGSELFRGIEVATGSILAFPTMSADQNDLCACGYGGTLTSGLGGLYYFGNYAHRFNPVTNWESLDYPPAQERGEAATVAVGDEMWLIGGRGPLATVERYSTTLFTGWSSGSPLPVATSHGAAAYLPPIVYHFGGEETPEQVFAYDTSSPIAAWREVASMTARTRLSSAHVLDGKIYLDGGATSLEVFDPATLTFGTRLVLPPGGHGITVLDGALYAIGEGVSGGVAVYRHDPP